jgi:hypothetical protein
MSPEHPLVGQVVQNMEVTSGFDVKVKGGGKATMLIGQEQTIAPAAGALFAQSEAAALARHGQPRGTAPEWLPFEEGARAQYAAQIAPGEGIARTGITRPRQMQTEWYIPAGGGARASGYVVPEGLGQAAGVRGRVSTVSLLEATLQADMTATGVYASSRLRKRGQIAGYISALKLRVADLRRQGVAAKSIEVHIHYLSPELPSATTQQEFKTHLAQGGLDRVTVFWHKI